jgi:hypothetical protein
MATGWLLAALIMAITIVDLPWAWAALTIAIYTLLPLGHRDRPSFRRNRRHAGFIGNLIWLVLAGWRLAPSSTTRSTGKPRTSVPRTACRSSIKTSAAHATITLETEPCSLIRPSTFSIRRGAYRDAQQLPAVLRRRHDGGRGDRPPDPRLRAARARETRRCRGFVALSPPAHDGRLAPNRLFHADQARRHCGEPRFHLTACPLLPQRDRATSIKAGDVERICQYR